MAAIEEIFSQIKDDGTLTAKDFIKQLFFDNETQELNDLKSDFKTKFIQPLLNRVKNIKPDEIKKITDPLGLSELKDDESVSNIKKIKDKFKEFSKMNLPDFSGFFQSPKEKLKDTTIDYVVPEKAKQETITEQKTFGPDIQVIEFSDENKIFFKELFGKARDQERALFEFEKKELSKLVSKQDEIKDAIYESADSGSLLGTLAKLLLAGGLAAVLLSMFWDSHIKPWLEEKFNIDLSFFDKFEGIVEGIAKFFSVSGLKLALGGIPALAGKMFTTFGQLLEDGIKAIFSMGFGDDVAKAGVKASPGLFAKILPKLVGGIFKGTGLLAAKAIPGIGALISFYFAYDRYEKGDYVGALIDVANGLVGFIPYAGVPLSIGLSLLNAFLDYKTQGEGKSPEEIQQGKLNILKDWGTAIYNTLKEVPFISSLMKMGEGIYGLIGGLSSNNPQDVLKSLNLLKETPLSFISNALLPIMEATVSTDASGSRKINFDKMKQMIGKQVLNWFPDWMRGAAAYVFGIEDDVKQQPPQVEQPTQTQQQAQTQQQPQHQPTPKTRAEAAAQRDQKNKPETFNEIPQNFVPINDGLLEPNQPIQMKLGNTTYETAPNDSVLAFKSGGVLDLALKDISLAISDINKNINNLSRNIMLVSSEKNNNPSVVNVNNSTVNSGSNTSKEYLFGNQRDGIFDERSRWWNITERRSVTVG